MIPSLGCESPRQWKQGFPITSGRWRKSLVYCRNEKTLRCCATSGKRRNCLSVVCNSDSKLHCSCAWVNAGTFYVELADWSAVYIQHRNSLPVDLALTAKLYPIPTLVLCQPMVGDHWREFIHAAVPTKMQLATPNPTAPQSFALALMVIMTRDRRIHIRASQKSGGGSESGFLLMSQGVTRPKMSKVTTPQPAKLIQGAPYQAGTVEAVCQIQKRLTRVATGSRFASKRMVNRQVRLMDQ